MSYSNEYCGLFGRVGEYNHDNSNCIIKNLSVTGSVECYSDSGKTGGIIGELAYGAMIKNCDFHGSIAADSKVGGIVGSNYCGGIINNCYSDAKIITSSEDSSIGGIIGEVSVGNNGASGSENANIENSYFNGSLTTSNISKTGAICGSINEKSDKKVNFNNNFFLSSACNGGVSNKTTVGCTKLSTVALKACADMLGSPYIQNDDTKLNNGYPVFEWQSKPYQFKGEGTAMNPYQISNKKELEMMRNLVNSDFFNTTYGHAYYIQTADIDLNGEEWVPIGIGYDKIGELNISKFFYGSYDGNRKYIHNLIINNSSVGAGLFGVVDGTESAKISRLVVEGSVSSSLSSYAGGVVGMLLNNAVIDGCGFIGDVSASTTSGNVIISAGGIAGIITNGGTISNCYHNGKILSNKNAGGILGTAEFTQNSEVTIENCYQSNGTVIGSDFASSILGNCIYTNSVKSIVNVTNCYYTNDSGTSKSSQNATFDNTLILSKSLLKKAAEDIGIYFTDNTKSSLNDGYPVFEWQISTSIVNGDGLFNIVDAVILQRWILADPNVTLNHWQNGDFCKDNRINVFDLCLMKRALIDQENK